MRRSASGRRPAGSGLEPLRTFDRIFGEVETPSPGGTWIDRDRAMATGMRAALMRHPAAIGPATVRLGLGPNAMHLMDAALGIFREAGFTPDDAADAYFTVANFVTGFSAFQVASTLGPTERAAIREYLAKLPPERYPNLVALARGSSRPASTSASRLGSIA